MTYNLYREQTFQPKGAYTCWFQPYKENRPCTYNHTRKKNGKTYVYCPITKSYLDKNQVGAAFKEVKSFQPAFVHTDKHVRTHYTICICILLAGCNGHKQAQGKTDRRSWQRGDSSQCAEKMRAGANGAKGSGKRLMPLTEEQKTTMNLFNCGYLTKSSYLKSIGVGGV